MSVQINENWERWIFASMLTFVKAQTDALGYHAYIEGSPDRDTSRHDKYIELRIDGPFYKLQQSVIRVEVELNVEISFKVGTRIYEPNQWSGQVAKILNNYIPVMKYGDEPGDDRTVSIGCLRVDDVNNIISHKYGQIATKTRLLQGTVEAKYWINLP